MYSKLGRYDRYLFCWPIVVIVYVLSISRTSTGDISVNLNVSAPTCGGAHLSFKYSQSDYSYQSGIGSIIIASPLDPASDYVCSCGSGYDATGISCYSMKCPSQGGYDQPRTPYGNSYGGRQPNSPYGPGGPGQAYGGGGEKGHQGISVGALVGSVETTYPCWKLKQMRHNTYVYLVCFVEDYPSLIYEMQFKENYQVTLTLVESIPSNHVSSVARITHTSEYGMTCLLAVFSTFCSNYKSDFLRTPSDCLSHIYYICPNNYKWKFCGTAPITSAVDVSFMSVQKGLVLFTSQSQMEGAPSPSGQRGLPAVLADGGSLLTSQSVEVDLENQYCHVKKDVDVAVNIGCLTGGEAGAGLIPICGVTKMNLITQGNMTMVAVAVNDLLCNLIPTILDAIYSSFICVFDILNKKILTDKCLFLGGGNQALDIQFVKGGSENCQFVVITSATGPVKFFCLSSIVAALNNLTSGAASTLNCADRSPILPTILPMHTGSQEPLFANAHSCSFKAKCCNGQSTCMTCTRPAKYGEKYLAELVCGTKNGKTDNDEDDDNNNNNKDNRKEKDRNRQNKQPYGSNYDDTIAPPYGGQMGMSGRGEMGNMRNGSFGMQFGMGGGGGYGGGRPGNYSGSGMGGGGPVYGPQPAQQGGHYYGQPHPYGAPPMPYQQQIYQG